MQINSNIKIIRKLYGITQPKFAELFSNVTLGMQKSYEKGTEPGPLYMQELSELSGVSEKDLRYRALKKADIKVNKGKKGNLSLIAIPSLTKDELREDATYTKVAITELLNQVAKLSSKAYNRPVDDCREEMEQNMILLLRDLKDGK